MRREATQLLAHGAGRFYALDCTRIAFFRESESHASPSHHGFFTNHCVVVTGLLYTSILCKSWAGTAPPSGGGTFSVKFFYGRLGHKGLHFLLVTRTKGSPTLGNTRSAFINTSNSGEPVLVNPSLSCSLTIFNVASIKVIHRRRLLQSYRCGSLIKKLQYHNCDSYSTLLASDFVGWS